MKTTIINGDILKHEVKLRFFWDSFSKFFQKQRRKGEKYKSNHWKIFRKLSVLEIKKKQEQVAYNLGNFEEKYIWISSSEASAQFFQKTPSHLYFKGISYIFKNFAYIFAYTLYILSAPYFSSQWLLPKVYKIKVVSEKLESTASQNKF